MSHHKDVQFIERHQCPTYNKIFNVETYHYIDKPCTWEQQLDHQLSEYRNWLEKFEAKEQH